MGAALPSVRQLASQLRVNPATVVQAYRQLEEVGVVESRQGAGTFVRQLAEPKARSRAPARGASVGAAHAERCLRARRDAGGYRASAQG